MTLQEFRDRLTNKEDKVSVVNFDLIHKVYMYHPVAKTKEDIVKLYELGGMTLIRDMVPRAEEIEKIEKSIRAVRNKLQELENQLISARY